MKKIIVKNTHTEKIVDSPLQDALSERYLAYAMSTIISRSIPDVRDGLKPVHRRLLYAMRELKLNPDQGFKKCARVVGDVIGKFHPHGDSAVYDAMVRLAQDFAVRYPLVEGQGNFGSVDGDNAAAMRYTEARLTSFGMLLMDGLDENAVDFISTYDGEEKEPIVMPASVPNLLANGSTGIAVGMATNIPPHNIIELLNALIKLSEKKEIQTDAIIDNTEIYQIIKGPDFPTGASVTEDNTTIQDAYSSGRGTFRIRANWIVEKHKRGLFNIIVTELPYQIQKGRLIERIADLIISRKLPFLSDIRDESDENIRILLEPKNKTIDPGIIMEQLYKQTDLEIRFNLNLNVLGADGIPKVSSLNDLLNAYLQHRQTMLIRQSNYNKERIEIRLNMLAGYLIAFLNLDQVIDIIRNDEDPKRKLMQMFGLNDEQTEGVLNMRLRALRNLEELKIKQEHDSLQKELKTINRLLGNKKKQWTTIKDQLTATKALLQREPLLSARRTEICNAPLSISLPIQSLIEKEPITVILTKKGWIKAIKGHKEKINDIKFKEGDSCAFSIHATTLDNILLFASDGRFYTIASGRLPLGRGFGEPLRLIIELPNDASVIFIKTHHKDGELIIGSDSGRGVRVNESSLLASTKNGRQVLNLKPGESACCCGEVNKGDDHIAVIGSNRKLLIFPIADVPIMARGRGVIMQRYKDGVLSDIKTITLSEGLSWQLGDRTRKEINLLAWIGKRSQSGRLAPRGFASTNKFN